MCFVQLIINGFLEVNFKYIFPPHFCHYCKQTITSNDTQIKIQVLCVLQPILNSFFSLLVMQLCPRICSRLLLEFLPDNCPIQRPISNISSLLLVLSLHCPISCIFYNLPSPPFSPLHFSSPLTKQRIHTS